MDEIELRPRSKQQPRSENRYRSIVRTMNYEHLRSSSRCKNSIFLGNPRAIKKERSKKRKKGGEKKKKINQLPKTSNSNDSSHSLPSLSTLRANEPRYRVRVVRWSGTEKGTGRGEEKKKKRKKKGKG